MGNSFFITLVRSLHMPVAIPLRGACMGLHPLKERAALEALQGLPPTILRVHQLNRLRRIVAHASAHDRFYREAWKDLLPELKNGMTFDLFRRLPILTVSGAGSPGEKVFHDAGKEEASAWAGFRRKALSCRTDMEGRMKEAQLWFFREWFHWERWDRIAFLRTGHGRTQERSGPGEKIRNRLARRELHLSSACLDKAVLDYWVEGLASFRPDIIRGSLPAVHALAKHILARGARNHPPKAVVLDAGSCLQEARNSVESAFSAEVFGVHALRGGGYLGCECRQHDGFHLNCLGLYIELVDHGRAMPRGRTGRIVFTDLYSLDPLIVRSMTGLMGTPAGEYCACGSPLPIMGIRVKKGSPIWR